MAFLTPLFLLLGLLAIPILLMYMLRLRRREMLVSSTLLWQRLLRDREANAPWQRLRRNLLLLLQLLILAALALALARPFLPVPSIVSGSVVVLLDGSASMMATDVVPDRFSAAREEVARLIGDLGGNSRMTLILVGRAPRVLAAASGDSAALRAALETAAAGPVEPDWAAAFALAAGAAQGFQDARVVIVSDGGLPPDLPPLPAEVAYLPVGESGENLALTALATAVVPADAPDAGALQLFAGVRNEGMVNRDALLSIYLDGALFDARRVSVPAGADAGETWRLPPQTGVVEARLGENQGDLLAVDDRAWTVHQGGISNRTLLVTAGNLFLEQVITVLPGVEAFKSAPDAPIDPDFDLIIFDGVPLPAPPPAADLLIVNPPASADPLFTVTGAFTDTVAVGLADSPLLAFVDWGQVNIRQAQRVIAPWAQPLVQAGGGPLLLVGDRQGQRVAIMTFDLRDSDLPLQIAFPVLMANITDWLTPGRAFDAAATWRPGDPVTLTPGASTTAVTVQPPAGAPWRVEVGEQPLIFAATDLPGLYRVTLQDSQGERPAGSFAVNLFSPSESAIQPRQQLQLGQSQVASAADGNVGQRELWPWLVGAAVLILVAEWWVHHRGTPRLKLTFR